MSRKNIIYCRTDRCIDCGLCETACADRHGQNRRIPYGEEVGFIRKTVNCLICEDHACMASCPVKCITIDDEKQIPIIDYSKCISCTLCVKKCSNGVLSAVFNNREKRGRADSVMKCDLCKGFENKSCIIACPTGALIEGCEEDFKPFDNLKYYLLSLLFIMITVVPAFMFYNYYSTPIEQRLQNDLHFFLKPGGLVGHMLGIVGTLLFLINLFYVYIRRFKRYEKFNLERNLKIHMTTGVMAFVLIIWHTAFKFNSETLAFYLFLATLLAVLTGALGRYVYTKLSFFFFYDESHMEFLAKAEHIILNSEDKENLQNLLNRLEKIKDSRKIPKSVLFGMVRFFKSLGITSEDEQKIAVLYFQYFRFTCYRNLLKSWHIIHIVATIIMFILLIVHILISFKVGYNYINLL